MTQWEYLTLYEARKWDKEKLDFDIYFWISTPESEDWEKAEEERLNQLLNRLGGEGWELVSQVARENGILLNTGGLHTGGVAVGISHVLKRPKSGSK